MENVKQIWQETTKRLQKVYNRREAENICFVLLEDLFGLSRADVLLGATWELNNELLENATRRLLLHEPLQYVTGVADFYGRKFQVGPGVLIPRPETEEMVALIIRDNKLKNPKILDVGVGSGCVAISLALALEGEVYGTELSEEAIIMARKNAEDLGAEVQFYLSDILQENLPVSGLDILVSNPPYIPYIEAGAMRANVTKYEPEGALYVPSDDPLLFYRAIAEKGARALKNGSKLYVEIHENFGEDVQSLLMELGYTQVIIYKDMQEKDRMVSAIK